MESREGSEKKRVLRGWKQISAYLDVSERTAINKEQRAGLPIRRTSKGDQVYAFEEDLDKWLESAPTGNQARVTPEYSELEALNKEQEDAPGNRRRSVLIWSLGAVLLGLLLVLIFVAGLDWNAAPASPVSGRLEGSELQILDAMGEILWKQHFPNINKSYYIGSYRGTARTDFHIQVVDLDGNGSNEVLFNYVPANPLEENGRLLLYSADGTQQQDFEFSKRVRFDDQGRERVFEHFFSERPFLIAEFDGEKHVIVATRNETFFPAWLVVLSVPDLEKEGEFVHPGHVEKMRVVDLGGDGRFELLVAGINNPGRASLDLPSLAIVPLPIKKVEGPREDPFGFQSSSASDYWLFPVPDSLFLRNTYAWVSDLKSNSEGFSAYIGTLAEENTAGKVIYEFSAEGALLTHDPNDDLERDHTLLYMAGKLDHRLSPEEVATWQPVRLRNRNGNANDPEIKARMSHK